MLSEKAVILLSGGLDSTTVLAIAQSEGYTAYALTIDYGQKNRSEIERAAAIAKHAAVKEHRILQIDLRSFGGSSLTTDLEVEQDRKEEEIGSGIPSTYVPARNTLFLSFALAWSEVLEAGHIFIGVNEVDSSGYPDCRASFIEAFTRAANLGSRLGAGGRTIKIHTPLQHLRKSEIIRRGLELGVDYKETNTCYQPLESGFACGRCDACILRQRAFHALDLEDPINYRERLLRGA